jgi:hypothetical protein
MTTKEKLFNSLNIEKKGDWDTAHQIVQHIEHPIAWWIHAYLHRKEPDIANASYWYSRANQPIPDYDFDREWQELYDLISDQPID